MILAISFIVLFIIIDQLIKFIALKCLKNRNDINVFKCIKLTYVENSGIAMNKASGNIWLMIITTIFASIIYIVLFNWFDWSNKCYCIGLILLVSGTYGNFIDRMLRRYVIDFIAFYIKKRVSPVFNLADFYIIIGYIFIAIGLIRM